MKLTKRYLTGKNYLATVTDLLQRISLEDAYAVLYEAADMQWRWREDDAAIADRQQFWFNDDDVAVAALLRLDRGDEWESDLVWLPSVTQWVYESLLPEVIATISAPEKESMFSVRENDSFLQRALERAGFVKSSNVMALTELASDPLRIEVPPGFALTSRLEDQRPHHLIRRNGSEVAHRLGETLLYRPELDLCIRDADGNVAAYALFWMDDVTKTGLLEPLRTERAYQRLGLARCLIAEGIARLRALGAERIRVCYSLDNEAAARSYHGAGFEDIIRILAYRRAATKVATETDTKAVTE